MESMIKWEKWQDHPERGDYLVAIRQKYPFEKEWSNFIEPAYYGFTDDFMDERWSFSNDWNEGQEYEFVGIANLDNISFPSGAI